MLIQLLFTNPLLYLMYAAAILLGFSVHEYSHAQASYFLGDQSAKQAGRLTINPFAHFDPVGTLLIFLVGIGWGKPVPFNPYNLRNHYAIHARIIKIKNKQQNKNGNKQN